MKTLLEAYKKVCETSFDREGTPHDSLEDFNKKMVSQESPARFDALLSVATRLEELAEDSRFDDEEKGFFKKASEEVNRAYSHLSA